MFLIIFVCQDVKKFILEKYLFDHQNIKTEVRN